ncbi:MAG: C4-type zinc ribbon domain-containing protein [Candidatus Cardinium sp.]|nr:C4-type zinc ribbon domain-containing protein [Candidatus Cardinium sp.]
MDTNIADKLAQLFQIQEMDIQLDNIIKLGGSLPEEVRALEEHIKKLHKEIVDNKVLLSSLQEEIAQKKAFTKQVEKKIQQYESQQMEVRNNREYDIITKELELQQLDIQLAEKFLRTAYGKIDQITLDTEELKKILQTKEKELLTKQQELTLILQANETESSLLQQKREVLVMELEELLYLNYERIRKSVQNKLAVVSLRKGGCGGCCIVIPPQQKLEIYERNKIIYCEHCGRMLIALEKPTDPSLFVS